MKNQVDSVIVKKRFSGLLDNLWSNFFIHHDFQELFLIDDIVTLRTGDQVLFVVEVEKDSRTEARVDLNHRVSERLFVDIQCQRKGKHVPKLEQNGVKSLNDSQKNNWIPFQNLIGFSSLDFFWLNSLKMNFISVDRVLVFFQDLFELFFEFFFCLG